MIITLQTNESPKNALDKTVTNVRQMSAVLKEATSFIDPVFLITAATAAELANVNYLECPDLNRKYFVNEITAVRNGLFEISAHVDVLSTYATEIRAQTAVVHRQENDWNLYLDDGIFKTYQNPYIVTKLFPNGFTTQSFVLAVAGS